MCMVLIFVSLLCSSFEMFSADVDEVGAEDRRIEFYVKGYKDNPPKEGYKFLLAAKASDEEEYLVVYTHPNKNKLKIEMGRAIEVVLGVKRENCSFMHVDGRLEHVQATLLLGSVMSRKKKYFAYLRSDINGNSCAIIDNDERNCLEILHRDPCIPKEAWLKLLSTRED